MYILCARAENVIDVSIKSISINNREYRLSQFLSSIVPGIYLFLINPKGLEAIVLSEPRYVSSSAPETLNLFCKLSIPSSSSHPSLTRSATLTRRDKSSSLLYYECDAINWSVSELLGYHVKLEITLNNLPSSYQIVELVNSTTILDVVTGSTFTNSQLHKDTYNTFCPHEFTCPDFITICGHADGDFYNGTIDPIRVLIEKI